MEVESAHRETSSAEWARLRALIDVLGEPDPSTPSVASPLAPMDPIDVCRRVVDRHRLAREEYRWTFRSSSPSALGWWDAESLDLALEVLLGEAADSSQVGSQIQTTLDSSPGWASIRIRDERRTARVCSPNECHGPNWALVRAVIAKHGGTVNAIHAPGCGQTVLVRLPLRQPDH